MEAIPGTYGDEGQAITASIDAMDAGLRRWDATLLAYENAMAVQIAASRPSVAAGMRVTLGAVLLERGRIEDALQELGKAGALDPMRPDVHLFRGLAYQLAGRQQDASTAFRASWTLDRVDPALAYRFLQHLPEDNEPGEVTLAVESLIGFQRRREAEPNPGRAAPFLSVSLVEDDGMQAALFSHALYAEGFARLARGEYDAAIVQFREAAAADPLNTNRAATDSLKQGIEALRNGRVATAVELLKAATDRAPDSSEAHRLLSTAYWLDQRWDQSVEQLEMALRLRPSDERSRLQLADVLVESGQHEKAEQVLKAAIDTIPASGQAHWRLGQLYRLMSRDGEARREFEQAARFPTLAGAGGVQAAIARMYLAEANLDAALQSARRRVALEPNAVEGHKDLGDVYRKLNQEDEALVEFFVATLLDPLDAGAYAAIGQIHLGAGRYAEAMAALRRTLMLNPEQPDAQYALAAATIRSGMDQEGTQQLEVAQRLLAAEQEKLRRNYQVNLIRIEAALRTSEGNFEEAARLWSEVAEGEPGVFSTYVSLGKALGKAGRHLTAIGAFERALKVLDEPDVYALLADAYRSLGRVDEAAKARASYEELKAQRLRTRGAGR
jgi:tetratricopeptide (TPR) repeat protein